MAAAALASPQPPRTAPAGDRAPVLL